MDYKLSTEKETNVSSMTYRSLIELYESDVNEGNYKGANYKITPDRKSALKKWLDFNGLDFDSSIGEEFDSNFQDKLLEMSSIYENKSTWPPMKSKIQSFNLVYLKSLPEKLIEDHTFSSFLQTQINRRGFSIRELSRISGVSAATISRMLKDDYQPTIRSSQENLKEVSKALGYPEKFLEENFQFKLNKHTRKMNPVERTKFGEKLSVLNTEKNRYGLKKSEWDESKNINELQEELNKGDFLYEVKKDFIKFFIYKTDIFLDDKIIRHGKWASIINNAPEEYQLFENDDFEDRQKFSYEQSETAKSFILKLKSFFGFLRNVLKKEQFHLSDVFDTALLEKYFKFLIMRNKELTGTPISFSSTVSAPVLYFYTQYPELLKESNAQVVNELRDKFKKYGSSNSWGEFYNDFILQELNQHQDVIRNQSARLKEKGVVTKEVNEVIQDWLDLPSPIEPIVHMIHHMKEDYLTYEKKLNKSGHDIKEQLVLLRDIVLIEMLLEKPIRAGSLKKVRFDKELVCKNDVWSLKLPEGMVKNFVKINHEFSDTLNKWISLYYERHHELQEGDYLVKTSESKTKDSLFGIISERIFSYCQRRVGPHAFRELRATHYIVNNPAGYLYAAQLLNDKIETVMKHYAHLENRALGAGDINNIEMLRNKYRNNEEDIIEIVLNGRELNLPVLKRRLISLLVNEPTGYVDEIFNVLKDSQHQG